MYLPEGHRGCCTGSLKGARAGKLDSQVLSGWGLPPGPSARQSEHRASRARWELDPWMPRSLRVDQAGTFRSPDSSRSSWGPRNLGY